MKRRTFIAGALIASLSTFSAVSSASDRYPTRNITDVVTWSAGGGTDVINRVATASMSKYLGTNINVINKPGGVSGSVGLQEGYNAPADGYTLVGLSESNVTAAVMGGWENRMDVFDYFIVASSPDVISVRNTSEFENLDDLVTYIKANPNKLRVGAGSAGSLHHINYLAFAKGIDSEMNFIPYPGSSASQNAALSGEIDVVITSVAEQNQLIQSGDFRALATLTERPYEIGGQTIPSGLEAYPSLKKHLPISQAIGFAMKKETPVEIKRSVAAAFASAMKSDEVQTYANENHYEVIGEFGRRANERMARLESLFSWTLWELEAARVNPESLDIPRPE
ncbi:tricarboxylate transport protein TctC [Vibrio breoganii]|uniref:Bug family tripartite tricarboxylate transporter substrate binding protein n=1 Tax=Vibrio breoganii TaxID=553239 RepID=UPI000C83D282|nr:tripartite tricarboxylate transporter substrate binding protein [Vibrio breoganii]PMF98856.1 tricarboxylate transport protein TctC [Vibrio breoganii]PMG35213.1 tricarboxylate transport protein TctC [Vibrio breoganii]PMG82418.1 tricarboxylate transport protein TctC [Vibrio breoganii]PMG92156.1 tricarboxylate transport protein TctC [Vibrio breoganii]PMK16183.1 tricarboxylate transport protein TctC [Vibrio breoganii]